MSQVSNKPRIGLWNVLLRKKTNFTLHCLWSENSRLWMSTLSIVVDQESRIWSQILHPYGGCHLCCVTWRALCIAWKDFKNFTVMFVCYIFVCLWYFYDSEFVVSSALHVAMAAASTRWRRSTLPHDATTDVSSSVWFRISSLNCPIPLKDTKTLGKNNLTCLHCLQKDRSKRQWKRNRRPAALCARSWRFLRGTASLAFG